MSQNYWFLNEGSIVLRQADGTESFPSYQEIDEGLNSDACCKGSSQYSVFESELGIRISALPVNVELAISLSNNAGIFKIELYALKRDDRYKVPLSESWRLGYILVRNVVYPLGGDYLEIRDAVSEVCDCRNSITLREYIMLRRILSEKELKYVDHVESILGCEKDKSLNDGDHGLIGRLYPYQSTGCNWLSFMLDNGCGCILGDEMGLGKTLQIIVMLGRRKRRYGTLKTVVVCPVSLIENWRREIERFYPSLKTLVHSGSHRTGFYKDFDGYDVIIASYGTIVQDLSMFNMIHWDVVILDEAQNIKNPDAKRTRAIKRLSRDIAVAVTGTPMENHLTDIWSITDFVMPGYLGTLLKFSSHFSDDIQSATRVEQYLSPIMIRRLVADVANDLPSRVDVPIAIPMTLDEAKYYESRRQEISLDKLKSMRLSSIQHLRMFCTHPKVYNHSIDVSDLSEISNKYQRLCAILEEIFEREEKVIVFTSFNEMIDLLVEDVHLRFNVYTNYINGSVAPDVRQQVIDEFSAVQGRGMLALNPRAAGSGLNITCANHVVHYNLEWNPAVEDQASARVYRHGQTKNVFIYRLYYANTIEDIINDKIQNKRSMSQKAVVGTDGDDLDYDYLVKALSVSPYKGGGGVNVN